LDCVPWVLLDEYRHYFFKVAIILWNLNRIFDGLDGVVARIQKKQSDFGGYFDLLADFFVYCTIPIGVVACNPSYWGFIALAFLQMSYCVNAVGLLMLSTILQKSDGNQKKYTTVIMPTGLIEGTETIIFYNILLLFPQHSTTLITIFTLLVFTTTLQRLVWAAKNIST
jgi:phosphatidylglycerophosphate synthase